MWRKKRRHCIGFELDSIDGNNTSKKGFKGFVSTTFGCIREDGAASMEDVSTLEGIL